MSNADYDTTAARHVPTKLESLGLKLLRKLD